jgi:bifunctional NMN adenylyltransferase/nudix hydrolase
VKSKALAVAVMRVQVPELHDGHRFLLDAMTAMHEKVLVVIGDTEARLSLHDPLPPNTRRDMIQAAYPNVTVTFLTDAPSDEEWSKSLDWLIGMFRTAMGTQNEGVVLYGARDSFLQHYLGRFKTIELDSPASVSGTEVRAAVQEENDPGFRRGMIYASKHRYPVSFQTVDAAILSGGRVLLGRKKRDGSKWRFVGGFVDPSDPSLEGAVAREVREETGLEVATVRYIGSERIDDYRYRIGYDKILSALFVVTIMFGAPKAGDDLDEVKWFEFADLNTTMVPEHIGLLEMLNEYLEGERNAE